MTYLFDVEVSFGKETRSYEVEADSGEQAEEIAHDRFIDECAKERDVFVSVPKI